MYYSAIYSCFNILGKNPGILLRLLLGDPGIFFEDFEATLNPFLTIFTVTPRMFDGIERFMAGSCSLFLMFRTQVASMNEWTTATKGILRK